MVGAGIRVDQGMIAGVAGPVETVSEQVHAGAAGLWPSLGVISQRK